MRYVLVLVLVFWFGAASASLVDNGSFTTDTVSGLDWLDISDTTGMSWEEAPENYSGWRHATNPEVEDLFAQSFDGYYDTNALGSSYSSEGAYADQGEDIILFNDLFGFSFLNPGINQSSFASYKDEDGLVTLMGTYENFYQNHFNYVIGLEFDGEYSETDTGNYGVFLVRTSVIPVPPALLLFGSALASLGWLRRNAL